MELRQLPGHHGPAPGAGGRREIAEERTQAAGGLEDHDAPLFRGCTGKQPRSLGALAGHEAEEEIAVGGKASGRQGCCDCRRSRNGHDRAAGGPGRGYQVGAGIADAGRAGIGDERDVATAEQHLDEPFEAALFGMGVVADECRTGAEVGEKPARSAGVLRGNYGDRTENLCGSRREVSEIAEGCGDDEKGCRVDLSRCAA